MARIRGLQLLAIAAATSCLAIGAGAEQTIYLYQRGYVSGGKNADTTGPTYGIKREMAERKPQSMAYGTPIRKRPAHMASPKLPLMMACISR